ncbi:hypothetical protein GW17_00057466 [Ensete ventricosum]|nr:hypothetical protein GW17_00057466 [Ensete ventricosum]
MAGAAIAGAAPPAREVPPEGNRAYRRGGCPCRRHAAPLPALQRNPRCRGRRSQRMVMRRSDETDDGEINNHRAWRCANAHIDSIVSD